MTISVGSFEDLEPNQGQPIDRNPSIPCDMCGESFNWMDYWKKRLSDDPREQPFWCDPCWGVLIEQAKIDRYKKEHHTLTEFER